MICYTDIAVVGAGPAGETAATAAESTGAAVTVIAPAARPGAGTLTGAAISRTESGRLQRIDGEVVSMHRTDIGVDVLVKPAGQTELLTVAALSAVIANGAQDVTLDFPGSHLAGVFSGRAALGARRDELAGKRVVVAGTGHLVLALAARLALDGVVIAEVVTANTGSGANLFSTQRWLAGVRDRRVLRECGAPITFGQAIFAAQGNEDGAVTGVTVAPVDDAGAINVAGARIIDADAVVVTAGQAPSIEFAAELGLPLSYDADGLAHITTDSYGRTDIPAVTAAGDVAGMFGVKAAEVSGRLAGLAAAVPVFGIATKVGKARELRHLANQHKRLHQSARSICEASPLIAADGVTLVGPDAFRVLPTTLADLAQLDVPERDRVLDAKESRLAEHFAIAAGEPALSSVIFDSIPE